MGKVEIHKTDSILDHGKCYKMKPRRGLKPMGGMSFASADAPNIPLWENLSTTEFNVETTKWVQV